jgi:hypothetical protein
VIRLLALVCAMAAAPGDAVDRSRAARAEFRRANPCPSTGSPRGPCPGHQVDHVLALCAGGPDHPSNMAWITVPEHKRKTAQDVAICKAQRAGVADR